MKKLTSKTTFVKPHYNEEAGFEGLWDHEIAKSLSVQVIHVITKLKRNWSFLSQNGIFPYEKIKQNQDGASRKAFFVPTQVAKYFVSSWKNNMGWSYWMFLLDCERVATELTPKLLARIAELESENKKLNASQPVRKLRKPRQAIVPIWGSNLWDEPAIIGWRRIDAKNADPVDVARGKLHHNRKIADGLARSNDQCQSILDKTLHPGAQHEEAQARDNLLFLQERQNLG